MRFGCRPRATAASGDIATKFRVNDENPVANLPTREQRIGTRWSSATSSRISIARGEGAYPEKEWDARGRILRSARASGARPRDLVSQLCSGYAELGKVDIAAANCGQALTLPAARASSITSSSSI